MANSPTTHDSRAESTEGRDGDRPLERFFPHVADSIRKGSFWTAIVLPFLYVPLLATGLSTATETATFLALLGLNLAALYVGHAYGR
ncbi:hypothetical protein [Natronococcus sp.]|uniref:hypothetical protein n=1 Tax=Natronococcus sp. TaxID=35747 RepID=UPI0025FED5EF|nr:hypothetical protein [Natronococcus sp.]